MELGKLNGLIKLHLQANQLTGSIPKELGGLSRLAELLLLRQRPDGRDTAGTWQPEEFRTVVAFL